jgi:hypothetical protein
MNIKVLKKNKSLIYNVIILKYKHEKYKCKGDVNMRKEVVFN